MRETAENREMTKRKSLKIEKKSYISVAWWEDVSAANEKNFDGHPEYSGEPGGLENPRKTAK